MRKYVVSLLMVFVLTGSCWADTFYCLLFSQDSKPISVPWKCHVWGTFVQVDDNGKLVKEVTLSWTPEKVSYLDYPGPGYDMTLKESLDAARNKHVRMWGPYGVQEELFKKAAMKEDPSDKQYKFIDTHTRPKATNCIHHLSDISGELKTGIRWGWWATLHIQRFMDKKKLLERKPQEEQNKVIELLNINSYTITRMPH